MEARSLEMDSRERVFEKCSVEKCRGEKYEERREEESEGMNEEKRGITSRQR